MSLSGSVAIVTGAAGFVGANLVRRLLADRADVHVVVRPSTDAWRLEEVRARVAWHAIDLTDAAAVRHVVSTAQPDVIFHLAKHRGDPVAMEYRAAVRANVESTLALLEAAHATGVRRVVHAGSSLEYDLTRSPLREDEAPAPLSVHGVTKAAASLFVQHFARLHGVPAVVLRLFTVYGPWEASSRFVPRAMMAALDGDPLAVTPPGLAHDWIFVDDVVEACIASVTADVAGEIINIATGVQTTNEEIVAIVERLSGGAIRRVAQPFEPRPWDCAHWVADVSKARARLGWSASYDLERGLAATLAWFRAHGARYRSDRARGASVPAR